MPTSSETKLPLCVRIIRNIATVTGALFIIPVIWFFVVTPEELEDMKIPESLDAISEQILNENSDKPPKFFLNSLKDNLISTNIFNLSFTDVSESEWESFQEGAAQGMIEKWRLERDKTNPSLQVPLKEFIRYKKNHVRYSHNMAISEYNKIDNPTSEEYITKLIAENVLLSLNYINDVDLTLEKYEPENQYNRDNWNFNSSAARERLNCTKDEHVDHIVALKEAFDSGASTWSSSRKQQFANDSINLWCLDAKLNLSKSDDDLAEWNGGNCNIRKRIAVKTKTVKRKYDLDIDPAEAKAIAVSINKNC